MGLRLLLYPALGIGTQVYITLFPAIIIIAWLFGFRPAMVTVLLGGVAVWYFVLPNTNSFRIPAPQLGASLIAYVVVATICAAAGGAARAASLRAQRDSQRFTEILASVTDSFVVVDRDWRYTYVNNAIAQRSGVSREQLIGKNVWDLFSDAVGTEAHRALTRAMNERVPVEYEYFHAPFNAWFIGQAYPTSDGGLVVYSRDVTKRKQAEAQVAQNQQTFFELVERCPFGIYVVDSSFRIATMNKGSQDGAFKNVRPVIGRSFDEAVRVLWPEPVAVEVLGHFRRTLDTGEPFYSRNFVHARSDIDQVEGYEWELHRITLPDGQFGVICYYFDSTKLRHAESALADTAQSLARERERLAIALRTGGLGVYEWRIGEPVIWWSPETYPLFGVDPATFTPTTEAFTALIHPDDRDELQRKTDASIAAREVFAHEYRIIRPDGAVRWLFNQSHVGLDARGSVERITGVAVDITERKRAEDALRSSEEHLELISNTVPALISYVDTDRRYRSCNDAYTQWFSLPREQVVGRHMREVLGDEAWQVIGPKLDQALAGQAVEYEAEAKYSRGGTRWIHVNYVPHRDSAGIVRGVVVMVSDITRRKHAEQAVAESERRYRSLVSVITDVPWTASADGRFVSPQQAWEIYTGLSFEQHKDFGWADAVHPDDREQVRALWEQACRTRMPYESRCRLWHAASKSYRHIVARGVPIFDTADGSTVREWVGSCTDVHEQHVAAESLRILNDELRAVDRRKDDFLAMLAHELRNPLAPVMNSIDLLDEIGSKDPAAIEARTMVRRQIRHMVRLIDDLMDVSRITRDRLGLKRARVDLVPLLRQAVEDNRVLCAANNLALQVDLPREPLWIDGDSTRLVQIVGNLLNNSCKYTPAGGRISLSAARDAAGSTAQIIVSDTGIGIAREDLPRLFEMFAQVHKDNPLAQGGMGIGLSLVKRLVEMHGGSISASSDGPGMGSTFEVVLPLATSAQQTQAAPAPATTPAAAAGPLDRNVLVVDDNKDAAHALARLLKLQGARTTIAHDGPEALHVAEQFVPDLVLLDIGLPSMSGYDVCRELRRRHRNSAPRPLIIALTGWGQDSDRAKSAEAGFDHHLVKPVHFEKLIALLRR